MEVVLQELAVPGAEEVHPVVWERQVAEAELEAVVGRLVVEVLEALLKTFKIIEGRLYLAFQTYIYIYI